MYSKRKKNESTFGIIRIRSEFVQFYKHSDQRPARFNEKGIKWKKKKCISYFYDNDDDFFINCCWSLHTWHSFCRFFVFVYCGQMNFFTFHISFTFFLYSSNKSSTQPANVLKQPYAYHKKKHTTTLLSRSLSLSRCVLKYILTAISTQALNRKKWSNSFGIHSVAIVSVDVLVLAALHK